jgi:hypothetical protein
MFNLKRSGGGGGATSLIRSWPLNCIPRPLGASHPELPNMVGTVNLDQRINAGDAIDPNLLTDAEAVVYGLKAIHRKMP